MERETLDGAWRGEGGRKGGSKEEKVGSVRNVGKGGKGGSKREERAVRETRKKGKGGSSRDLLTCHPLHLYYTCFIHHPGNRHCHSN